VLGVGVSATSYADVVRDVREWALARRSETGPAPARIVCVTSVHGLMIAREDAGFRQVLNGADVVTPDGMPVVWALRSFGERRQERVYGPTLMLELCRMAAGDGLRIFLFGSRPEVLPALERNLRNRFPALAIAGSYSPPFRPMTADEAAQTQRLIQEAAPDVIFVGISTPKQERWMWEHRNLFPGVVLIGVGAAFDFHAGRVRQAPNWMQRRGLEWAFRLMSEPRRLWRRYLLQTPRFIPYWAMQKLGLLRYELPAEAHDQPTPI